MHCRAMLWVSRHFPDSEEYVSKRKHYGHTVRRSEYKAGKWSLSQKGVSKNATQQYPRASGYNQIEKISSCSSFHNSQLDDKNEVCVSRNFGWVIPNPNSLEESN